MTHSPTIRRALISVSDKSGLDTLAPALQAAGVEVVSTGSTAATLRELGIPVTDVASVTGFAEAFDGRVKTLHPSIHGGILADRTRASHRASLEQLGIQPFDLVVVNLYPFEQTLRRGGETSEMIENIDIGGPALIRAAAKNHQNVAVVVDPRNYPQLVECLESKEVPASLARAWAGTAFAHTAHYDQVIANWFADRNTKPDSHQALPDSVSITGAKVADLRYGENAHQIAAIYQRSDLEAGLAQATVIQGKEMSYNNYLDAEAAVIAAFDHDEPAVAIIKHQNPCGIARADSIVQAYRAAHACDPLSAFGGVIALNRALDVDTAQAISEVFTEVVIAPAVTSDAQAVLGSKKNLRLVQLPPDFAPESRDIRLISGGFVVQSRDRDFLSPQGWQRVAGPGVDEQTMTSLDFAVRAVKSVKSNAIALCSGEATVGIGMGQVNRVDACQLAVNRAGDRARGSVAASDAFFPFPDGLEILINAGVTAVVSPGGSVRDDEVIARAEAAGITLFHTGQRHFLH